MSYKHRRDGKSSSYNNKAKIPNREIFNRSSSKYSNQSKKNFDIHLYDHDREDRINAIVDDDDGDLILQRQSQAITTEKPSRIIEANDRRHDAIIFGDKTVEEQQKNQLWNSFKQSSKYSTTSLAGPLLLQDPQTKRLRWKEKIREQWIQRENIKPIKYSIEGKTE